MQIARVLSHLEPGGLQLSAMRLSAELARHGVSTRFLVAHATDAGLALYRDAGVDVELWGSKRSLQYEASEEFAEWLRPRLGDADLAHGHAFGGWWATAMAAPGWMPALASEHNALRWPGQPQVDAVRAGLARVDRFFAHGPAVREQILAFGLPPERIVEGRSPVPQPDIAPPGPSSGIVFVGRLHTEKGPDVLLHAASAMRERTSVVFVGAGPAEAELHRLARDLGLQDRVRFSGWQRDPAPLVARAAVCAVPSRHDSFSQAAILAMALGVPVIGAAVDGLALLLADDRGIAVPPEDPAALAAALDDAATGRRIPDLTKASAFARSYLPERVARGYLEAYEELARYGESSPRSQHRARSRTSR